MVDSDIQHHVIVGFEIHVQLATQSKLFCGCAVEFGAEPNSRTCPVCLGLPGALPVMNRAAVEHSMLMGAALGCEIVRHAKWDRKSYYYPDLPKNYQISQYDLPIARNGRFEFDVNGETKSIGIIRAHLEEDAGKNVHDAGDYSLVDLNRTGTPLLEIVTEPDIRSAEDAYAFCTELQRLVTYLGISEGVMQKGQMRFEPNVNVAVVREGQEFRTPITEVKNLNSFRAVRGAIEYEHRRQVQDWLADNDYLFGARPNENRGWNDDKGHTVFQRSKEAAEDYRYFPDPDLVPLQVSDEWIDEVRERLPEMPGARRRRLIDQFRLSEEAAGIITADLATATLFDDSLSTAKSADTLSKQFVNIWAPLAAEQDRTVASLSVGADRIGELALLVDEGAVSATSAKKIAGHMLDSDKSPRALADSLGLIVVEDQDQMDAWVDEVLKLNASAVDDAIANPKKAQKAIGFLRGQVMRVSGGKANAKRCGEIIEARIAELAKEQ